MRGAWSGEPFDYSGAHYTVEAATTRDVPSPVPRLYFGGASDAAERIAARHVDVYLAWGEPPAMVSERLERMRSLAAAEGRTLDFGIRFHVIARPTAEEAWAAAGALRARMSDESIAAAQADFATTQSVGQQRMAALHGGDDDNLLVSPNVWAGIGLVRGGVGTALVGSYEEVADRIEEYHALGFDEFILSGYPHLEEAYWFGEGVMPVLRARGLLPPMEGPSAPVFSFR
jgi:alkanesulfonate monooxygenase